jgi:UDP-N-acetylglucosamine 4,6-dehydratase
MASESASTPRESYLDGRHVLVTGGTGSFGQRFIRTILERTRVARVVVFSRDEFKQFEMAKKFVGEPRIRFFIGDVRDHQRLLRAFDGVHVVVHTAAMKQVPAVEYNPIEAIRTNINGGENVINAAMDMGVKRVIALSTDKASSPVNLYGATKLVSDKLFVFGNAYVGGNYTRFSVVRYGNVVGSRGSVVPLFLERAAAGLDIPITHEQMTRFWITLDQGVQFVLDSLERMRGGEIFVPKIPSMRMLDLAAALAPGRPVRIIGIRPGEKLHEEMISPSDSRLTVDMGSHYIIQPDTEWWRHRAQSLQGTPVPEGFSYSSDRNTQWLTPEALAEMVRQV